jgi:hypothetical protein
MLGAAEAAGADAPGAAEAFGTADAFGVGEGRGVGVDGGESVGCPCGTVRGTKRMYPIDTVASLLIVVSAVAVV